MSRRTQGCLYRKKQTRNGRRIAVGFYRARYIDADGDQRDHAIVMPNGSKTRDKQAAEVVLERILKKVARKAVGLNDPEIDNALRPIGEVLADYVGGLHGGLNDRGDTISRKHVEQVDAYCLWVFKAGDISRMSHFTEERIDAALDAKEAEGVGPRTINAHRDTVFGFGKWCVKKKLLALNPASFVGRRNQRADVRKRRRALTVEEAYRLLSVCGPRRLFYATLLWTGLRVSEAMSLQWSDFDLDGVHPCLYLRASTQKVKRDVELPVHSELAELLRAAKPGADGPVFTSKPTLRTFKGGPDGRKLKDGSPRIHLGDLGRAQISVEDDRGRSVDLHSLRTSFG